MTDIDLLPLPQWTQYNAHLRIRANSLQKRVQDYARANVAHATAPLQAEIEALRAEVAAVWNVMPSGTRYLDPPDGGDVPLHEQVRRMAADAARAERLAEALRWYVENDDTNERQEGNEYWLAGRDRAIDVLSEYGYEVDNG